MWGSVTVINVSFYRLCPTVQYGTGINKAWNSTWGENRIGTITCYPKRSVQKADFRLQTGYKMQTRYKTQKENKDCFSSDTGQHVIWKHTECRAVAFLRSSFTNISITCIVEYFLLVPSYILSLTKRSVHMLFICCSADLPADLPVSERPPRCRMRRQQMIHV